MDERIILPIQYSEDLRELLNTDKEIGGCFIGERADRGITILEGEVDIGELESVDINQGLAKLLPIFNKDPFHLALILFHSHSVPFGRKIKVELPYWSANQVLAGNYEMGTVVNNFFISRKVGRGDSVVASFFHDYGLNYHLFVHPRFGTDGTVMDKDKIDFTGYKYSETSIGRVIEIPVLIE